MNHLIGDVLQQRGSRLHGDTERNDFVASTLRNQIKKHQSCNIYGREMIL
jgi:hypothetical protein